MPEDWIERQFEKERQIRASLPPNVVEAIGGAAGQRLLAAADEADRKTGTDRAADKKRRK